MNFFCKHTETLSTKCNHFIPNATIFYKMQPFLPNATIFYQIQPFSTTELEPFSTEYNYLLLLNLNHFLPQMAIFSSLHLRCYDPSECIIVFTSPISISFYGSNCHKSLIIEKSIRLSRQKKSSVSDVFIYVCPRD